jgi:hypothetical protein
MDIGLVFHEAAFSESEVRAAGREAQGSRGGCSGGRSLRRDVKYASLQAYCISIRALSNHGKYRPAGKLHNAQR